MKKKPDNKKHDRMSLPPMSNEILWLLEEAGAETITTLLNTLSSHRDISSREAFLKEAEISIGVLFRLDYITANQNEREPLLHFASNVSWDEQNQLFIWKSRLNSQVNHSPEIVLTDEGMDIFRRMRFHRE